MGRSGRCWLIAGALILLAGCWPAPGAGPDRRAHNPFETTITPETVGSLGVAWTEDTHGQEVSDPVVSTRGVHVTSHVVAEDAQDILAYGMDGGLLWSQHSGFDEATAFGSTIADVNRGRVAVSVYDNAVQGTAVRWYDTATGAPLTDFERTRFLDGLRGSRALFSLRPSIVQIGFEVGEVDDPSARWGGILSLEGGSSPLTLGTRYVYQAGPGLLSAEPPSDEGGRTGVRAFPLEGGSSSCGPPPGGYACPVWVTLLSFVTTSPVIGEGEGEGEETVYAAGDAVYALDAATGALQWIGTVDDLVIAPPALADGLLYVGTRGGTLAVFDADGCGSATCAPLWTASLGGQVTEQPAVAGGVVFTASGDASTGTLNAFPAAGCGAAVCSPLWTASPGSGISGAPAVSAGRLFVGTVDGRLIAYRPAA